MLAESGANLYLGYQKIQKSNFPIKGQVAPNCGFYPLDVATDEDTKEFFDAFSNDNPGKKADIMIHAIGFAPRTCLIDRSYLLKTATSIRL